MHWSHASHNTADAFLITIEMPHPSMMQRSRTWAVPRARGPETRPVAAVWPQAEDGNRMVGYGMQTPRGWISWTPQLWPSWTSQWWPNLWAQYTGDMSTTIGCGEEALHRCVHACACVQAVAHTCAHECTGTKVSAPMGIRGMGSA